MSLKKPKFPTLINRGNTSFFMWSHIIGWLLANIQTIWIIYEIRRNTKLTKEVLEKQRRSHIRQQKR